MFWRRSSDWEFHIVFFHRKLIDGTTASGHLMRRYINGEWQYRVMTSEEEADYANSEAW